MERLEWEQSRLISSRRVFIYTVSNKTGEQRREFGEVRSRVTLVWGGDTCAVLYKFAVGAFFPDKKLKQSPFFPANYYDK